MEKKTNSWEMTVIFYAFILICIATLADIIPGVEGSPWAVKIYGIVCLVGVIYCAKKKLFMAIDSFTLMYPKGLQHTLEKVNFVLELICLILLEAALAVGFMRFLGLDEPMSIERGFTMILYVLSMVVYPITAVQVIRSNGKRQNDEKKGGEE